MKNLLVLFIFAGLLSPVFAQDRDTKVRNDKTRFETSDDWIYGDLEQARQVARATKQPLLVIFRCIPCEACSSFDEQVIRRDAGVRELMDQFVCVRIPKANTIDLAQFQFDFDLSYAAFCMHADGTIYARYGTRSSREDSDKHFTLAGFAATLAGALEIHKGYPLNKGTLAGKQPREVKYKTPGDYPDIKGKYGRELNYEGEVAKSCLHCHQIRDAERRLAREEGNFSPQMLFPYPMPDLLGLKLDPQTRAMLSEVPQDSSAALAGLQAGDELLELAGQPILSIADAQWVLHHAPAEGELAAKIKRAGREKEVPLALPEGWREQSDISWRVSTWNLRRMALGGMVLQTAPDAGGLGLQANHVGQYGEHAAAKRAGFQKGDILLSFGELQQPISETALIVHTLHTTKPGDAVEVTILRGGQKKKLKLPMQ